MTMDYSINFTTRQLTRMRGLVNARVKAIQTDLYNGASGDEKYLEYGVALGLQTRVRKAICIANLNGFTNNDLELYSKAEFELLDLLVESAKMQSVEEVGNKDYEANDYQILKLADFFSMGVQIKDFK